MEAGRRGREFTAFWEEKKEDMALIVEKEENQVRRNILASNQCLNISSLS